MRKAVVLFKDQEAGVLTQHDSGSFTFRYHDSWMENNSKPAISLTLPKTVQEHFSEYLFPLFYNILPEGSNKLTVCQRMRIDSSDFFGLLITIAQVDVVGAIRVIKMDLQ